MMIANRHRNEFPTLASGIHLLRHSLGPAPRAARESMSAYIDAWEHHTSEDAWATSWWELSRRVGDRIARILGGAPGPGTSQAKATPVAPGRRSHRAPSRRRARLISDPANRYPRTRARRLVLRFQNRPQQGRHDRT